VSISNVNRLRTKRIVSLFPGIHLRKLQRVMNTSFNTTRYHVHNLERAGEIVCSTEGGHTRLYPIGLDAKMREMRAAVLNRTSRKILSALLESGPLGNGELSDLTNLAKSTVSEHTESLRKANIVRRNVSVDGSVTYEVQGREDVEEVMAAFQESLLSGTADRFIDLWDL
jgi:predicted transcriptional regulator